jgi:hypothetical protein
MACIQVCTANYCSLHTISNTTFDYTDSGLAETAVPPTATFTIGSGNDVKNENMDRLAASINDERQRRYDFGFTALTQFPFSTITGTDNDGPLEGVLIYGNSAANLKERMQEIKRAINQISSGYVTYDVSTNKRIKSAQITEAYDKIEYLRSECMCNGDCGPNTICPCHANCTCNTY